MNRAIRAALLVTLAVSAAGCDDAPPCTPSCAPGFCGSDGCGGACGCFGGEVCAQERCVGPTCTDGLKGGAETDVDCGGPQCPDCEAGKACLEPTDCASGRCDLLTCAESIPPCQNGSHDGEETDVDCGGPSCPKCENGKGCLAGGDCASGRCGGAKTCEAIPGCENGKKDGQETDQDCGGPTCARCEVGKACQGNGDCASNRCDGLICKAPLAECENGKKDGQETDQDCGGPTCPKCADGKACGGAADCLSGRCGSTGVCEAIPGCENGRKDGQETDADCGGPTCARCALGKSCVADGDCASGRCGASRVCVELPACENGVKDGQESDTDCGGPTCPKCADGEDCRAGGDCRSGKCGAGNTCEAASQCENGAKDGDESDKDCGGSVCGKCADGKACGGHPDCLSGICLSGVCAPAKVTVSIGGSADAVSSYLMDAGQGEWNVFSGTSIPLGRHWDPAHVSYHAGLRFPNVGVPKGASIKSAKVTWFPTNEVDSNNNLKLKISAERTGDSAPFNPSNMTSGRPDQRLKTLASIDWIVRCDESCDPDLFGASYCAQRALDCWNRNVAFACPKDLKALVQEVVDNAQWQAGNAISIFFINAANDNDGPDYKSSRSITTWDTTRGTSFAPKLEIELQP